MWNRVTLKSEAKMKLRSFYWMAVSVCAFVVLLPAVLEQFVPSFDYELWYNDQEAALSIIENSPVQFFAMFGVVFLAVLLIEIFITSPLSVGLQRFFLSADNGVVDFSNIFYGFRNNYLNVVKVMFLKNLFIFLWSLVFLIPGYIKIYEYYFIDTILAENTQISFGEAKAVSKRMTDHDKLNIFVLNLSFAGWIILGSLVCGLGGIFVVPYISETNIRLYRFKQGNFSVNVDTN